MSRESRASDTQPKLPTDPDNNTPAAFFEAGLRLLQAGQLQGAEQSGRRALAIDPGHADSLHLMGLLSSLANEPALAIEWFAQAIRQNPDVADYFFNLAHALKEQARPDEAIKSFDRGLRLQPAYAEGWFAMGELLQKQKRFDEAIMSYDMALKVKPAYGEAAYASGLLYFETRRYEEALARFTRSVDINPNQSEAFNYMVRSCWELRRFADAMAYGIKAIALAPDDPQLNKNLGALLQKFERHEEAIGWLDKALALRPDFVAALNDRSISLLALLRIDEAFAAIDRAIAIDPECAICHWNKAVLQLLIGDFAGWKRREWGRKCNLVNLADRQFTQPRWFGEEPIADKTILLHNDEGLGDTIQFVRYVPLVAQRGARVILQVQDALQPLLSGLEGVSLCLPKSAGSLPDFDLHCPLSGLPLAFKTRLETIPAAPCYLSPIPQARRQEWQSRLGGHDRLRVGLVWSGNPRHGNDHNRSMTSQMISEIIDPRARFYSLQKNQRPEDQATLAARSDIVDLTEHLVDFVETAALVSCLDLIVTVDTSVAHLAGALGKPTWILLPYSPDCRWLLDRDDSPWYPSVRLFRQDARRDYAPILQRIREELESLIATFRPIQDSNSPAYPRPDTPAALFEAGLRLLQAGQLQGAEQSGRRALAIDPGHADSLHLMGLLSLLAKQYAIAIEWFAEAIRRNPNVADYFFNLASALKQQGRIDEAIKSLDRALVLQPDYAEGWYGLGELLQQQKRLDEAIMSYDVALKCKPTYREAANASGLLYFETKRYEEALARFTRSLEIEPNQPGAFNYISRCHWALRRFEEALTNGYKAIALAPDHPELNKNLGLLLQKLDRHEEALAWFDKALALRPDFTPALNDLSTSLFALRRIDEAFAAIDRAIAIDPECADYHWNKALLQLLTGDFAGWKGREWGRKCTLVNFADRKFKQPQWFGEEPVAGKTILLHADEGFGDTIQFARYARLVAQRGARVILEVQNALHSLLSGIDGAALCLSKSADALPDFDLHCPLSSVPLALNTQLETIPAAPSYLPPLPEARLREWQARLGAHDRFRVGLVWSGNPQHANDRARSTTLRIMSAILDSPARFYSLQKELRPEDQATVTERTDVIDLTADLTNFVETAALASCLDLVITVDTSVAHLAAALGKPTWILLPFTPDYRWLLDRDDSPWYPTVRLFRQDESRDYARVLQRVRTELQSLIAAFRP
jgi:tetratricopeptide (TPR) repeat protein